MYQAPSGRIVIVLRVHDSEWYTAQKARVGWCRDDFVFALIL